MINPIDKTIIDYKQLNINNIEKIAEIPFDFVRKRLSIVVKYDYETRMIVKGAFHSVIDVCSFVKVGEGKKLNDEKILSRIQSLYEDYSNDGIRVLGVATKQVSLNGKYIVADENDLVFEGFILLSESPKSGVKEIIADLKTNGVNLKVITGDNRHIANHIAKQVGFEITGTLTGDELMAIDESLLINRIKSANIFAEVDPNQKERIIKAFQKSGFVVGYMGDGINDVSALHAADVSISVENASDIAKESADFVLIEKSFKVLNDGIDLGRKTFNNTIKYILITTSANFGNMLSMAVSSVFLPFLPLVPVQILLINFLTDFPALNISRDNVDEEILEKPRSWDVVFLKKFMLVFGLISSMFDILAFAILYFGFKVYNGAFQSS